jgi:iron complex outermembrane receptor protein
VRTRPIVAVRGDRNNVTTSIDQYRIVGGLTGDLPNFPFGEYWSFDVYYSFTESSGKSSRMGIRQDRLDQALDASVVNGEVVCNDPTGGCVAVNMYSPTLFNGLIGDFATQAERDWLFDSRDFDTTYKQSIFAAFMSGEVGETDAGAITAGFGIEIRNDDLESIPDDIARDGLFFGFFSDEGATGDKSTEEAYAEIEIPLLANMPGVKELTVNLSGRYTKDEFYDAQSTHAVKVGWRPVDSLLLRGTYGTSYRAPNVRENFLANQSGFINVFDPCVVPEAARTGLGNTTYDPSGDKRPEWVLANCAANGIDPTAYFGSLVGDNTEITTGGVRNLTEEKSSSSTYGFAWEVPAESFKMTIGATYYHIDINDTIVEPSGQSFINGCYSQQTSNPAYCQRIQRDGTNDITLIQGGFANRDNETVEGVDVNINWSKTIDMFDYPVKWAFDATVNHVKERSETYVDDNLNFQYDNDAGEFGFPDRKASLQLSATWDEWRVTWNTLYMSSVAIDADFRTQFSDIDGTSDTCLGPDAGDVLCRDVDFADSYQLHSASVTYTSDTWSAQLGMRNVFDTAPPAVDSSAVLANNNVPLGYGYDINGRTIFLNVNKRF